MANYTENENGGKDDFIARMTAMAAFATIDFDEIGRDKTKLIQTMVKRVRTAETLTNERALPVLILGAIRIRAHIKDVSYEESSHRYVITFVAKTGDNSGDEETIRSMRTDDYRVSEEFVRTLWEDKVGRDVILYKYNEMPNERQQQGGRNGGRIPPKGYRTAVYVDIDRNAGR